MPQQAGDAVIPAAIIGAGMAGIACSSALAERLTHSVIFEKSRSFGGRCATRLWLDCVVDHGAQYFTAHTPEFLDAIRNASGSSLRTIEHPIFGPDGAPLPAQPERPRFYHSQGNNRLAKELADGLEVRREHTLKKLLPETHCGQSVWQLEFAEGGVAYARTVVLTSPWPQTAQLFGFAIPSEFQPCLTGFFAYQADFDEAGSHPYARMGDSQGALAWSACENRKQGRIREGLTVFVVQSGPAFSKEFLEAPYDEWLALQRTELEAVWGLDRTKFFEAFGHRWRYARNPVPVAHPELPPGIFLAGDTIVPSRVEDAWLSGRACAARVLEALEPVRI